MEEYKTIKTNFMYYQTNGYGGGRWKHTPKEENLMRRIRELESKVGLETYSVGYTEKDVKQWKAQDKYMGYGTWQGTYEYVDKEVHVGSGYTQEAAQKWVNDGPNRWMIRD